MCFSPVLFSIRPILGEPSVFFGGGKDKVALPLPYPISGWYFGDHVAISHDSRVNLFDIAGDDTDVFFQPTRSISLDSWHRVRIVGI